jgi:hypothetical protein
MVKITPKPSEEGFLIDGKKLIIRLKTGETMTSYTVSIDGSLSDKWGQKLGNISLPIGTVRRMNTTTKELHFATDGSRYILDAIAAEKEGPKYSFRLKGLR